MIDDAKLKELYSEAFVQGDWMADWRAGYLKLVAEIRDMSDLEYFSPAVQERLWSAREITPAGSGETVPIGDAPRDPDIVRAIGALRNREWPDEPELKAEEIQSEFDRILEMVNRSLSRSPTARLWRLFAAVLPEDMLCIVSWLACRAVMKEVLPAEKTRGLHGVAAHVLIRARFRAVLGPEKDLAEHVQRATFAWFLYERISGTAGAAAAKGPGEQVTPISIWPYHRQNKGLPSPSRNVASYRDIVRAADGGARIEEIVANLESDSNYEGMNKDSLRQIIGAVKKVGLIESREGQLFPTEDGLQFLETNEPDPLVVRLIERIYPFAHLLRWFADCTWNRNEVLGQLQALHPGWTTRMQPSQILSWTTGLGLVEKTASGYALTDYGKYWVKRLPEQLPVAPAEDEEAADEESEAHPQEAAAPKREWPPLADILKAFDRSGLVIDRSQLIALHNALHCNDRKRFVILSGLSGTGKTRVMQTYAELYCQALKLNVEHHREVVAVAPDWRDPNGLLGYVNELREDPVYQPGPALRLLLDANKDRANPYFLLLDEMNLARVELYFAPFLSAMETGGKLALHTRTDSVSKVPPSIPWPSNLFIIGSVNMDETTHPFSDKVLDRAFTLEFWNVDLKTFFEQQAERDAESEQLLSAVHDLLRPIRRHFGYRTAKEFLGFVRLSAGTGDEARTQLLDHGIFSKVLPRLRGEDSPALREALGKLNAIFKERNLERSANKVAEMAQVLERSGVTRFWA